MLALGGDASEVAIRAAVARFDEQHALLAKLPAEVRGSVSALAPLAHGENVVAALPFAIELR
jgi:hypothetical protein